MVFAVAMKSYDDDHSLVNTDMSVHLLNSINVKYQADSWKHMLKRVYFLILHCPSSKKRRVSFNESCWLISSFNASKQIPIELDKQAALEKYV